MSLSEHVLTFGYWPARQLSGQNPAAICHPQEYAGSDVVNIACTQTGLQPRQQRNLVDAWCSLLPELPVKTILFSSKVNQDLFEAAAANSKLEALFLKWSSVASIAALTGHPALTALYVGSSPSLTGLERLATIPRLQYLFLEGVRESADLAFAGQLPKLVEFGLSGGSRPLRVESFKPLQALERLAILWLVRVRPLSGGLEPLHRLSGLRSFRTSLDLQCDEVVALRNALPALKYFQPVW